MLAFFGNFQFRALVLGCSPCSVGSRLGYAASQKRILSVPYITQPSSSSQGVRVGLLQGLKPRNMHSHLSIDVSRSILIFSVLRQFLEGQVSGNPRGLPSELLVAPTILSCTLVGIDGGFLPWYNSYNMFKARCRPTKHHWHVELNVYQTSLCLLQVGMVNPRLVWVTLSATSSGFHFVLYPGFP